MQHCDNEKEAGDKTKSFLNSLCLEELYQWNSPMFVKHNPYGQMRLLGSEKKKKGKNYFLPEMICKVDNLD